LAKFADVNTVINGGVAADVANVFYKVKTVLKAAGWTVPTSSDGLTYSSSADVITHNSTGAGGLANSNAWYVVREPGGRREWCIQHVSTALVYRIKYSPFARFVGGTPGILRVPSATDEGTPLCGAGTDASPTGANFFNSTNLRLHIVANSTPIGACYPFLMWVTLTPGVTEQAGALWQEPMAPGSYDVADVDPCIVGAGTGGGSLSSMLSNSSRAWFAYGTGSATFVTMTSGVNATFTGTLAPDLASGKDVNGRPIYTGTAASNVRVKGYGATVAIKGPPRAWPSTANRTTDASVYLSNLVLPYPDNTEPGV
jgi:hypothetical protein